MSELEKGLKAQLESVIKQNQMLLEKHYQQDSKIVKLIEENNYYKNKLQQKENKEKKIREYINWRLEEHQDMYKYQMEELLEILDEDFTKKSDCNYEKVDKGE